MKKTICFLLLASSTAYGQGDVGLTLSSEIAKSNVSVMKAKTCTYDERAKKNVCLTDVTIVIKESKRKPKVVLKDSTEHITRYLIFNNRGQLVCDSGATGGYTKWFKYDTSGAISEISTASENSKNINTWERSSDTVFCFTVDDRVKRKELYFIIIEDKKHKPLQLYVPLQDGKTALYAELKYDVNGYLIKETFFNIESEAIQLDYKYENDSKGLFTTVTVSTPTEKNTAITHYKYEYYK